MALDAGLRTGRTETRIRARPAAPRRLAQRTVDVGAEGCDEWLLRSSSESAAGEAGEGIGTEASNIEIHLAFFLSHFKRVCRIMVIISDFHSEDASSILAALNFFALATSFMHSPY
jgi:hypothetical protein